MITMTTKELTEYLHQVVLLESSIYQQEKSLDRARSELSFREPKRKEEEKLKPPAKPKVSKELEPGIRIASEYSNIPIKVYAFLFCGFILFIFFAFVAKDTIFRVLFTIIGLAILLIFFCLIYLRNDEKRKNVIAQLNYEKQLETYNRKTAEAQEKHKVALAEYEVALAEFKKKKEAANKEYQAVMNAYNAAKRVVENMANPLAECKNTLEKLYALDIIFPKYRNMVAVCSLYEYLLSGRCSTLEGPDGAYNLYESELRQNIIIEKLDTIINRLDIIIKNQYTLYSELQKTNEILGGIEEDVKNLIQSTNEIKEYSRITAVCAHATAQNTEALKYLALING